MKCKQCDRWFYTSRALNIHIGRAHKSSKPVRFPDLVGMGVMKRPLTREESAKVTQEVMAMGLDNPDARFTMAVLKAVETVQQAGEVKRGKDE
jgi:hypothetical protein